MINLLNKGMDLKFRTIGHAKHFVEIQLDYLSDGIEDLEFKIMNNKYSYSNNDMKKIVDELKTDFDKFDVIYRLLKEERIDSYLLDYVFNLMELEAYDEEYGLI